LGNASGNIITSTSLWPLPQLMNSFSWYGDIPRNRHEYPWFALFLEEIFCSLRIAGDKGFDSEKNYQYKIKEQDIYSLGNDQGCAKPKTSSKTSL
jgi:hypothetical protein